MASIRRFAEPLDRLILVFLEAELAELEGYSEFKLRIGVASIRRFAEPFYRFIQVNPEVEVAVLVS